MFNRPLRTNPTAFLPVKSSSGWPRRRWFRRWAVRIPIAPATYMFSFISWTVPYTAVEIAILNELPSELAILQRPVAIPLVIVDMDKRGIHRRFCVHAHSDAGGIRWRRQRHMPRAAPWTEWPVAECSLSVLFIVCSLDLMWQKSICWCDGGEGGQKCSDSWFCPVFDKNCGWIWRYCISVRNLTRFWDRLSRPHLTVRNLISIPDGFEETVFLSGI